MQSLRQQAMYCIYGHVDGTYLLTIKRDVPACQASPNANNQKYCLHAFPRQRHTQILHAMR